MLYFFPHICNHAGTKKIDCYIKLSSCYCYLHTCHFDHACKTQWQAWFSLGLKPLRDMSAYFETSFEEVIQPGTTLGHPNKERKREKTFSMWKVLCELIKSPPMPLKTNILGGKKSKSLKFSRTMKILFSLSHRSNKYFGCFVHYVKHERANYRA